MCRHMCARARVIARRRWRGPDGAARGLDGPHRHRRRAAHLVRVFGVGDPLRAPDRPPI